MNTEIYSVQTYAITPVIFNKTIGYRYEGGGIKKTFCLLFSPFQSGNDNKPNLCFIDIVTCPCLQTYTYPNPTEC